MNRRELLGSAAAVAIVPLLPASAAAPAFEAVLRFDRIQQGPGYQRLAQIVGGEVAGTALRGEVRSGRMEWLVDPCSGAVEIALKCRVLRADGMQVELRDRSVHAGTDALPELPGLPSAPVLLPAGQTSPAITRLIGRVDAADFGRGMLRLRAFEMR